MDKFRLAKIRKVSEKCLKQPKETKKKPYIIFKKATYVKWLAAASLGIVTAFTFTFAAAHYFTSSTPPERPIAFTRHVSPYTPPIKPQLFAKSTHESDQLIASISNELIEKEFTNKQKTEKLVALEQERSAANKKILWMEASIDALSKTLLTQTASQENQLKQYEKLEKKLQSQKEKFVNTNNTSTMYLQSLIRSLDQLCYLSTSYKNTLAINLGMMHALQTEYLIANKQQVEQKKAILALYDTLEQHLSLTTILEQRFAMQELALTTALNEAKQDNEKIFLFGQQLQKTLSLQETLLEESENRANTLETALHHKENKIQENQQLIKTQFAMINALQNKQKKFPNNHLTQKDDSALAMEEIISLQKALTRKQKALAEERMLEQKAKVHFDQQIAEAKERIESLQKENASLQNQLKIEHYRFIAAQKAASLNHLKDHDFDASKPSEVNEETEVIQSNESLSLDFS